MGDKILICLVFLVGIFLHALICHFPCVAEKVDKDMIDKVEEWSVEELEMVLKLVVNEWQ